MKQVAERLLNEAKHLRDKYHGGTMPKSVANEIKSKVDAAEEILSEPQRPDGLLDMGDGGHFDGSQSQKAISRNAPTLPHEQKDAVQAWTLADERKRAEKKQLENDGVTFGGLVKAAVLGEGSDVERKALSVNADGTFLVPDPLSAEVIDYARARTRTLQAGATLVPMRRNKKLIGRVDNDPTVNWHQESGAITANDPAIGGLELEAKTLPALVRVSRELLEDSDNVDVMIRRAIAGAIAVKVDEAALVGDGTGGAPTGLLNETGVNVTHVGTVAPSNFDVLVDANERLRLSNHEPSPAVVVNPREAGSFSRLKDANNQPMQRPAELVDTSLLASTSVPTDRGAGGDEALMFTGDWTMLYLGVRSNMRIQVLNERYADSGEVAFFAWSRWAVGVADSSAFELVDGVIA